MSQPSWREFRRHRAVEQGCSLPPPAPPASIVLLPVRKLQIGRETLSQNQLKKFHSNPEPRHDEFFSPNGTTGLSPRDCEIGKLFKSYSLFDKTLLLCLK
jgi:hypothetical protein